MELHTSGEDYLEAVLILSRTCPEVRSVDIAEHLGVSRPSVSRAVSLLRRGGFDILVTHSPAYQLGDGRDLPHQGFRTFVDLMDKYHPQYMCHGHVHQSYRYDFKRVRHHGDTTVINACGYYFLDIPEKDDQIPT